MRRSRIKVTALVLQEGLVRYTTAPNILLRVMHVQRNLQYMSVFGNLGHHTGSGVTCCSGVCIGSLCPLPERGFEVCPCPQPERGCEGQKGFLPWPACPAPGAPARRTGCFWIGSASPAPDLPSSACTLQLSTRHQLHSIHVKCDALQTGTMVCAQTCRHCAVFVEPISFEPAQVNCGSSSLICRCWLPFCTVPAVSRVHGDCRPEDGTVMLNMPLQGFCKMSSMPQMMSCCNQANDPNKLPEPHRSWGSFSHQHY